MSLAEQCDYSPAPFSVETVCDDLLRHGWSVSTLTGQEQLLHALNREVTSHRADAALTPAGVGRADDHQLARRIRRDRILWLDGTSPAQTAWLTFAETLRLALNRRLMMGLFRHEAHFALYEAGGFYRPHYDSFRGARNRLVSTVLYLNEGWDSADGGLLRLYDETERNVVAEIVPELGTFVTFLSEDVLHEVTEAACARASIAGWYRLNDMIETPALQGTGLADRL